MKIYIKISYTIIIFINASSSIFPCYGVCYGAGIQSCVDIRYNTKNNLRCFRFSSALDCRDSLQLLSTQWQVTLVWVLGLIEILMNENPNGLKTNSSNTPFVHPESSILVTMERWLLPKILEFVRYGQIGQNCTRINTKKDSLLANVTSSVLPMYWLATVLLINTFMLGIRESSEHVLCQPGPD